MSSLRAGMFVLFSIGAIAQAGSPEYLVRLNNADADSQAEFLSRNGGTLTLVSAPGNLFKWVGDQNRDLSWDGNIRYVQTNHQFRMIDSPSLVENRAALQAELLANPVRETRATDNPDILNPGIQATGADPMLTQAWGVFTTGANLAWPKTSQGKGIIVAVTDTGVDYNHPDLMTNMWRNKKEIPGDGIDNDGNGFVDDLVGWDFASNDNKPFDLSLSLLEILFQGGNPGHGTHVSGVVGAQLNNGQGVAGVAPQVQIMALRFITEKGSGNDADAIKAIDYAVANGANIINASWGGEKGTEDDSALIECIERANKAGVIFVAAAGNGRVNAAQTASEGFDNDSDAKPMVPATFDIPNIVSVAATDDKDALGTFSNWGHKSVKLAAPGVKILSTIPGGKYQDTIVDLGSVKATWDGTSMAAPFVSGALAVIWSKSSAQTAGQVISDLLTRVTPVAALKDKVATGGRLDLRSLR